MRWLLLAVVFASLGCARGGSRVERGTVDGISAALIAWASPPVELRYERHRAVADVEMPSATVRASWSREPGLVGTYDVRTAAVTQGAPEVAQRFVYGRSGLAISAEGAVVDGVADWVSWEPPLLVLPAEPAIGARWESGHQHGDVAVTRTCELLGSDLCPQGLVAVCEREQEAFRLVTRDHFCRGQGWSGYESLLVRPGQPPVRTWTTDVRDAR